MIIRTVGVVGGGTMGQGIAITCAAAGLDVLLSERTPELAARALAEVGESLDRDIAKWRHTQGEKKAILARIHSVEAMPALEQAEIVIEAVSEDLELKTAIFQELDRVCPPEDILASNTSTLSITEIAARTRRPDRVIGLHFLHPVPKVPLVEVVRGLATSDMTYRDALEFVRVLGKTGIEVFEYPGYVTTRVMLPFLNEAMHVVMEGVATAEAVDTSMKLGYGLPVGPLALADRMGLDEVMRWMQYLFDELGDVKYRPCPLLRKKIRAGHLGVKAGRGFFEYDEDGEPENRLTRRPSGYPLDLLPRYNPRMRVLVLDCGSSSLKFQLIETDEASAAAGQDHALAKGLVDNIGGTALLKYEPAGKRAVKESDEILEHKIAVERCLALLTREDVGVIRDRGQIQAVGHRVVHGGERFKTSVLIDDDVLDGIEDCFELAPLHNPPNVKGYRAARDLLGTVPHVAVFDTSFHQSMPPHAFLYALPYVLYQRHGIRRYGFHGTSHRFVSRRLSAALGRAPEDPGLRLITCHLGNGCSVAAIRAGRSIDTSMGFTPLEGLVMGSRSGDLDPAILLHIMAKEELSGPELNALLNKHSGLLGVSGTSNDMRALLDAEAAGNERARLAVDLFCYRLTKYIAAYVGALGGVDALAFAGGIGENAPAIRSRALRGLESMGLALDPELNQGSVGQLGEISAPGSRGRVFVIPTNEELLIARDTFSIVTTPGLPPP